MVSKAIKTHINEFKHQQFSSYQIQYCLPDKLILLVTLDEFDLNLILINVNKLKPYRYVKQSTKPIQVPKSTFM
jgi:hypothetical protein